jgi:hypothetical protein
MPETHQIILPMTRRICLRSTRGASQLVGAGNNEEPSYTPSMLLQQTCHLGFRTGLIPWDHNCPVSSLHLPLPWHPLFWFSQAPNVASTPHRPIAFRASGCLPGSTPNPAIFPRISYAVGHTGHSDVVLLEHNAAGWEIQKG